MPTYGERLEEVNQGDIFAGVPFVDPPAGDDAWGMVISHDCDVDKFLRPARPLTTTAREAWRFTLAVVHPLERLSTDRAGNVRADHMPRYLYLAADAELPELCVDLWTEQPVLAAAVLECERVASLSPESRERLWWKLIRLRLGRNFRAILEGNVPADEA